MIETEVEPPPPNLDDDGEPTLTITVVLRESDGTGRAAYVVLPPDADNATLAEQIVSAAIAASALRDPVLAETVREHMRHQGET